MSTMLSLEEAQAKLLALAPAPRKAIIETHEASGLILANDVFAQRTQPAADLSAMDGYAICGDGPWKIAGESRAGTPFSGELQSGECARISTGAHMPVGSSRVLIQENAAINGKYVEIAKGEECPPEGEHVRKAGFDFKQGSRVLEQSMRISPGQIALAIASGHATLPVLSPPRIAILDSGDELVRLPAEIGTHQIPASNGMMLAAMTAPLAGRPELLGPVPDDLDAFAAALGQADQCDILITSGGASVGDHDLVQEALLKWGAQIEFWKVAIKPGKPLLVAVRENRGHKQLILGLPGNPVSSFVTCFLFGLPLIRAMLGWSNPMPVKTTAELEVALPAGGERHEFLRGRLKDGKVTLAGSQDSSALLALADANCLIDRPPNASALEIGHYATLFNLDNGAIPRN